MRSRAAFTLLLFALTPAWAWAQQEIAPGGVATVVLTFEVPAGTDSARYRFDPADGFRSFAGRGDRMATVPGQPLRLPLTFGVPATLRAGAARAGMVRIEWSGGGAEERPVHVRVAARRAAEFSIGTETAAISPATPLEVSYRLWNRGNLPDTFRVAVHVPGGWTAVPLPDHAVLEPGDAATGTIRITPPQQVAPGSEHVIATRLTAAGVQELRSTRVVVVSREARLSGLTHLPSRLFVGSSTAFGSAPAVALSVSGDVGPGVNLSIVARHMEGFVPPPAFRGALTGPRLQASLDARAWSLRLGDLFTMADLFHGPVSQGRGVGAELRGDVLRGELLLAVPSSYAFGAEDGYLFRTAGAYRTGFGTIGIQASAVRRESASFQEYATAGGGLTYSLRSPGHDLSARIGVLHVEGDSATATGPAAEARYLVRGPRGSLNLRVRKVPAVTQRTVSLGNEAFVSGNLHLHRRLSALGWAFGTSAPMVDDRPYSASRGGAAGIRSSPLPGITVQLLGSYRELRRVGTSLPTAVTRSARASLDAPIGPVVFEAAADAGTITTDSTRPLRQARSGLRWTGQGQWAWLGFTYYDGGSGAPFTTADLSGAVRLGRVDLQGGINARPSAAVLASTVSFWTGASVPIDQNLRLDLGADYLPGSVGSPWRLSIGASRSFGMPIPMPRRATVQGVLFEDLDGDGIRGPDDPVLEDVPVLLGPLRTRTDHRGRFRFHDPVDGELQVDLSHLPLGYVVSPAARLRTRGQVEIPVVRTSAVVLRLFFDQNATGSRERGDPPAHDILVSIRDASGRLRDAVSNEEGLITFIGIPPGSYTARYTVVVRLPEPGRQATTTIESPFVLEPGVTLEQSVPIPVRQREIRMPTR